ncbi:DUF4255 domain-containing protein [Streptomyces sp. NBC_01294]|uniref:DUF4255 domain-containing protein n=1 Tax=Streptomyces sp. NBC_01294 TaxID=2903815 RepID=UPI002DDAFCA4|nr:DUF4255 domain-containing protein [Streptomyces sp. NBC_01294]WRZ56613.1 DUF4255 domain-containing protein [Streptomyces sp. NBC_01294]
MIHEVDEGLRRLLAESGLEASGVEVVFDAPTRDWAARRSAPTVCVFLYDIREDHTRRGSGAGEVYDADGFVVARRTPPRWFDLTYLVTAWASRPQDEHRLLSQVLACLVSTDTLPPRLLGGTLADLGLLVDVDAGGTGMDAPAASDVWSALGGELKPSLGLRVKAPLAGISRVAAAPVTEGVVVRSVPQAEPYGAEDARRLRYVELDEPGEPGPEGFGGSRERPRVPARRRRGERQP